MVEATCPLPNWTADANLTEQEVWNLLARQEADETVYKIPAFILLATLMITGLPGNLLVLLVYGFRFPASTTKSFIMAMAAFDLMNCILGLPFEMADLKNDMTFDQPPLCKFMRFLVTLSTCGSSTVLVCVSIDRFRRICQPFQKQMTVKQSRLIIGLMTLLSVFMAVPALVFYGKQTEIRYGVETYDCTIDDKYRDTKLVALYQFFLGGVWIVSVIILIIMYSFIIYKIHKQKSRRAKQSATSFGNVILTNARMGGPSVRSEEQPRETQHDTNTNGVGHGDNVQVHANQDKEDIINSDKPAPRQRQFSNVSFKRLFSRDVNPILEETEDNDEINDISFYIVNDENIAMSDRAKRKKSETLRKASLNNYLSGSRDTDFIIKSISFVSQTETNADPASSRKRKVGHHMAKHRSWGSAEFLVSRQVNVISKSGDRKWTSLSCSLLDSYPNDYKNDGKDDYKEESPRVFRMRRASSLPSVRDAVAKWQQGKPYTARKFGNKGSAGSFSTDESKTSLEINLSSNCWDSKGSLTSASETSVNVATVHDPRHQTLNVTWEAIETTRHQTGDSLDKEKKDNSKPRSASVATTLSNRNRNASAREIKTSTVSIMMLMVTLAFILSYLPHLGIQAFKIISSSLMAYLLCHDRTYFVFHHILIRSFFINNAINPIIYSFYNKTFRARCSRVLKSPKSLFQSSELRYGSGGMSISQDNDTA